MVYAHIKLFIVTVKNRKCGKVTRHCRKARLYRADSCLPVAIVKIVTAWRRNQFQQPSLLGSNCC